MDVGDVGVEVLAVLVELDHVLPGEMDGVVM